MKENVNGNTHDLLFQENLSVSAHTPDVASDDDEEDNAVLSRVTTFKLEDDARRGATAQLPNGIFNLLPPMDITQEETSKDDDHSASETTS
jgi:hypothetical protein